ncbi:MAG: hypothetical protein HW388_1076 [Dehalococcoidia bacterium]|nr:hypothetical protein [Dehalococcoidia bacterium]
MISTRGDSREAMIAWVIGGFVLSVLALFSIMGGLVLTTLLLVATPFILGFLVMEAAFGKRPVYVTFWKAEEERLVAPVAKAAAGRVAARVIHVEGTCPQGCRFEVGDTLRIDGSVQGAYPVCSTAERLLKSAAIRLKDGSPSGEEVRCVGAEHRVIFALQGQRRGATPSSTGDMLRGRMEEVG